ncbi:hypothetical protein BH09PSE6_BH09PSE6_17640 [soil metagenome]
MRVRVVVIVGAWMASLAGAPVQAKEWYLFYGEGKKPDRHLFYAQDGITFAAPIGESGDNYRGVTVTEVIETTEAPDRIQYILDIRCDLETARVSRSYTLFRNADRGFEQGGDRGWKPVNQGPEWIARARRFACAKPDERTLANKMAPVGDYIFSTELADISWANYWKDGTRPPYTTSKSKEQIEAARNAQIARLEQQIGSLRQLGISAKKDFDESNERDRLFQQQIREDTARRGGSRANLRLESWIGASEQQLVEGMGTPHQFSEQGEWRYLSYTVGGVQQVMQGNRQIGEQDYRCTMTFDIRQGKIFTYRASGAVATCQSTQWVAGPFPEKSRVPR